MPLQFAEDYSYGKHVSIWIRHGKQDKMKIVVLNSITLFNQNSNFCHLKREESQMMWCKTLLQSHGIKTWLLMWSVTGGSGVVVSYSCKVYLGVLYRLYSKSCLFWVFWKWYFDLNKCHVLCSDVEQICIFLLFLKLRVKYSVRCTEVWKSSMHLTFAYVCQPNPDREHFHHSITPFIFIY